ncbi:unnamed protein product, partial [Polarella glacialis]
ALVEKAKTLMMTADWDQALESAGRLQQQEPNNIEALRLNVLFLLSRESRCDAAAEKLQELVAALQQLEPKNHDLVMSCAQLFSRLAGRHKGILAITSSMMERVTHLAPDQAKYLTELGYQQVLLGELPKAEQTFHAAVAKDEEDVRALYGIISCRVQEGNLDDAEEQLEFLSEIQVSVGKSPDLAFLQSLIAWRKRGDVEAALNLLNETFVEEVEVEVDLDAGEQGFAEALRDPAEEAAAIARAEVHVEAAGAAGYTVDKKKLGEGSYGTVSMCSHKDSLAVKSIAKKDIKQKERFQQEIDLMKLLDHPNIIKLYETFEDRKNIYLVMELCTGGELFDRIIELQSFTEVQAAIVMKQILGGISYMHASKICHRDLKPENFLFTNKDPIEKSTLKIIDFGLASKFKEGGVLSTKAGTPYYVAPQVLAGAYNQSADLWSCGVIMFVLLVGYPPFHGETDNEVLAKVKSGRFHFEAADWKNVSEDAKYLIRQLLKMNPPERYTAEQALNHTWVVEKAPRALNAPLSAGLVANLQGFRSKNKLKKAALHVIASQMSDAQIKSLRDIFMSLDSDGDGLLTAKELTDGMNKAGFTEIPADFAAILKDVDSNGSGVIDYTEFL